MTSSPIFRPTFHRHQLQGDRWPEETDKAFVDYVAQGGGVVSVHAAANGYPDWTAIDTYTNLFQFR